MCIVRVLLLGPYFHFCLAIFVLENACPIALMENLLKRTQQTRVEIFLPDNFHTQSSGY